MMTVSKHFECGRLAIIRLILSLAILTLSACSSQNSAENSVPSSKTKAQTETPVKQDMNTGYVDIQTNLGHIIIQLDASKAPKTVENFMQYVTDQYYDGTIFHRVIKDFMIQGGGFTTELHKKSTRAPVINEADNGLKNLRGTIAMARTQEPHSATSQFFINHIDNSFLDHKSKTTRGWGYTVFGKVVSGMDIVDKISAVKTGARGPFGRDVPLNDVIIEHISATNSPG